MITFKEMLCNVDIQSIPEEHLDNLKILFDKICQVRIKYNKPFTFTNSYRSKKHHLEIYATKGITDIAKIPMNSGHLRGECVDIQDTDGSFREWILNNLQLMKDLGLWLEDFRYTKGWTHLGIKPPKSNKRIFIPYLGPIPHPELWDGNYAKELD